MHICQSVILASVLLFVTVTLRGETSRPENELWSVSQDTSGIRKYTAPFPSRENIPVGPRSQRWVTRSEFAFFNISLMTGTDVMQADLLKLNHRIFNVSAMSVIDGHDPYAAKYFLPFGVKASLLNSRYFNVTAGADMYLFPFGADGMGRGTYYEGDYVFGSYGDELEYSFSQFIDARISIEASPFVGVKGFIGCRVPITPYSIYNLTIGEMTYERGSPFVYAGISGSLQLIFPFNESVFYRCYNERDNRLRKARRSDSPTAYESIVNSYPGTPYAKEAGERLEYIYYSRAMYGTLAKCNEYLSFYPEGKYVAAVKNRRDLLKEETAYLKAMKGSTRDLEDFLAVYPDGKNAGKARAQLDKLLEEEEFRVYQGALKGTFDSCDVYIGMYPSGKYITEVNVLRAEKLALVEEVMYRDALEGSFVECDRYLKAFPDGKYSNEIRRKRDLNYIESEITYYKKAVSGNLEACNEYLTHYPSGKFLSGINSLREVLLAKFRKDMANAADNFSLLILRELIRTDSAFTKSSGYIISGEKPFVLYVNMESENHSRTLAGDSESVDSSSIQQRSMGNMPDSIGENARLLRWNINGTLIGTEDNQPVRVLVDDRGFMKMSASRTLLATASIDTEGWLMIDGIRFELQQGVLTYSDRNNPGVYSEGSIVITNGILFIFRNGEWTMLNQPGRVY